MPGKLNERLHFAYRTAEKAAKKSADKQKAYYDLKARHSCLKPEDRVLVKNVGLRGKRKIADKWESYPYVVKSQPMPDIPVYEVIPENPRARKTRLPFSNISPRVNRRRSSSSSSDELSNEKESQPSVLNLPPLVDIPGPSAEDSDGGTMPAYPAVVNLVMM